MYNMLVDNFVHVSILVLMEEPLKHYLTEYDKWQNDMSFNPCFNGRTS